MYNILLSRTSHAHTFTQLFVVYIYIVVTSTTLTHLELRNHSRIQLSIYHRVLDIDSLHTPVKTNVHLDDYQLDNFMQVIGLEICLPLREEGGPQNFFSLLRGVPNFCSEKFHFSSTPPSNLNSDWSLRTTR